MDSNCEFTGMIVNNRFQGNGNAQMVIQEENLASIANNIFDGQLNVGLATGVWMNEWCETFVNNIVINCNIGVHGPGGWPEDPEVNYCLLWNNNTDFDGCQEGAGVLDVNPQFVDFNNGDLHLGPASPCIDAGLSGNDYRDLNHTRNDMGCFGGPTAAPEMAGLLFGTVVAGQHEVEVQSAVPAEYEYIVPANVSMEFDEWVHVESDALLDVGSATMTFNAGSGLTVDGEATISAGAQMEFAANGCVWVDNGEMNVNGAVGDLAVFSGINGGDWQGIIFCSDGGHNSVIDFADISGSTGYGIDWSDSFIDLLSNSLIHDNENGISTDHLNDDVEIVNCEIFDNDVYGIFGGEVAGTVFVTDCDIYSNGDDGIRIAGSTEIDGCSIYLN